MRFTIPTMFSRIGEKTIWYKMIENTKIPLKVEVFIRKASLEDAREIAIVRASAWKQSYRDIIDEAYLSSISLNAKLLLREKILQEDCPDKIHLVATYRDNIVGFCDTGPTPKLNLNYLGEIYAIYLLDEFKNIGIGSLLLKEASLHLRQKKLLPYIVWVLKDNQVARTFYERNGGILLNKKSSNIGDKNYDEVSYIFR